MATITTEMTETYFRSQPQRPLIYFLDEIRLEGYVGIDVTRKFKEYVKQGTPKLNIDWSLVR